MPYLPLANFVRKKSDLNLCLNVTQFMIDLNAKNLHQESIIICMHFSPVIMFMILKFKLAVLYESGNKL
jgi:hypothetical protein